MFKRRRRPQRPTVNQLMTIRKYGLEPPCEYLVLWDNGDMMKIMHHSTRETMVLEK